MVDVSSIPFGQIFMLPVDEVVYSGFNPEVRTTRRSLYTLKNSIESFGGIKEPVKVSRDGKLGDGHRRVACAKMLGIPEVPAIRYDLSAEELFVMNGSQRSVTTEEWAEVVTRTPDITVDLLPRRAGGIVSGAVDLVGLDGIRDLHNRGVRINVINDAKRVANYVENNDPNYIVQIVDWLVKNKQAGMIRQAMNNYIDPAILTMAIEQNKPLRIGWSM